MVIFHGYVNLPEGRHKESRGIYMGIPAYAHANEHAGTHIKIPSINPIARLRARYSIFFVGEL